MAYSCAQDGCDQDCAVMEMADEVTPIDWEWHMLDEQPAK